MTPALQDRVIEVHPEVSFRALAARPLEYAKRKPAGYDERRALLEDVLEMSLWSREKARAVARPAQPDDLLDATVVAWTAYRFANGSAERLPPEPPVDRRGLRMEIVY
jgi:predicted RNase H-like nuclease